MVARDYVGQHPFFFFLEIHTKVFRLKQDICNLLRKKYVWVYVYLHISRESGEELWSKYGKMLTLGNVEGSMWDIYNIPITFKIILKFQLKNK